MMSFKAEYWAISLDTADLVNECFVDPGGKQTPALFNTKQEAQKFMMRVRQKPIVKPKRSVNVVKVVVEVLR